MTKKRSLFLVFSLLTLFLVSNATIPSVFAEETGFENYETEENVIKINNTLNEFSTVAGKEDNKEEGIWDGNSFVNEYTKYEELENQRKIDEHYEKIAKIFENSAFDFDLEKYKETGDLDDCLVFNVSKAVKMMKDDAEVFETMKNEVEKILDNLVNNDDFIDLITSIFGGNGDEKGGE